MRNPLLAAAVASIVAATALGAGLVAFDVHPAGMAHWLHPGADEASLHDGHAGDMDHDAMGMDRPRFPAAVGSVPTPEEARNLDEVNRIVIEEDAHFTPANGVRSGAGTLEDPYVLSGYYIPGDLYVADTDACFVVRGNFIGGQLTLNWNGRCAHVHHNYIRDLRVNENVERSGYATGGLIERNKISYVGQLRHFDGEFRHNVVGPFKAPDIFDTVLETVPVPFVEDVRVANVDGFNQGLIHHNTFHGSVDLDLHGHHHGSGFFAPHSHYHGADMDRDKRLASSHGGAHDHTDRWTSVSFTDNRIIDPEGYGLRYEDQDHAGDDRTAQSEETEELEEDHRHHTHIVIARNTVEGAGIWIDVFNADDDRHPERNPGWLEVDGNTVSVRQRDGGPMPWFRFQFAPDAGIQVATAKQVQLSIRGNHATFIPLQDRDPVSTLLDSFWYGAPEPAAIRLDGIRDANITVSHNTAEGFTYGVWAREMDAQTSWTVEGNRFDGATQDVWYDDSVASPPQRPDEG